MDDKAIDLINTAASRYRYAIEKLRRLLPEHEDAKGLEHD